MKSKFLKLLITLTLILSALIPVGVFAAQNQPNYNTPSGNQLVIKYAFSEPDTTNTSSTIQFKIRLMKGNVPYANVNNLHYLVTAAQGITYAGGQGVAHTDSNGYLKNGANIDLWSNLPSQGEWTLNIFDGDLSNSHFNITDDDRNKDYDYTFVPDLLNNIAYEIVPSTSNFMNITPADAKGTISGVVSEKFTLSPKEVSPTPGGPTILPDINTELVFNTCLTDKNYKDNPGKAFTANYAISAFSSGRNGKIEVDPSSMTVNYTGNTTASAPVKVKISNAIAGESYTVRVRLTNKPSEVSFVANSTYELTATYKVLGEDKVEVSYSDYYGRKLDGPDVRLIKLNDETSKPTATVSSIAFDKSDTNLKANSTLSIKATVKPDDAVDKTLTWSSSDTKVATVSNGNVKAIKAGTAFITAKSSNGVSESVRVTVTEDPKPTTPAQPKEIKVTSVGLNQSSANLEIGKSVKLTATVNPSDATNKAVTWSTSNSSVASVSNGTVTAHKAGSATITVKTNDGSRTATCSVTVKSSDVKVSSVSISPSSASVDVGKTVKLTATVNPSNATNKNVTWTSSSTSIATVNNGTVTGVKAGTATITVKTADGNKTATCKVTVKASDVKVSSVSISPSSASVDVGKTVKLTANINPSNATNKNVTWTSSSTSIVTVNNGTVTGVKAGTATITVKTADGNKTATCKVTVKASDVKVSSVSISPSSANVDVGKTVKLTANINPSNATNKNVTWTSSSTSIATVSNGTVTGKKAGTATITVKTADGNKTATCKVTVKESNVKVTGVKLSPTTTNVDVGKTVKLTATVSPTNATNKSVTWTSSSTSIATVSNGTVTGKKAGTATITVKTADGNKTATCKVTVKESNVKVTGVKLSPTTASVDVGKTVKLTATVSPTNATNKNVTWTSSSTSIATVSNGTVTGKKAGTATITVKTADGNKTATCKVTVKASTVKVTGVKLSPTSANVDVGKTVKLTATVSPTNATNKNVTWTSSSTSIATVSNGTVTGKKAGTATITVKTADGSKTATCKVTVKASTVKVTGVKLSPTTASVDVGKTVKLTATVSPTNATNKNVTWTSSSTSIATVSNGTVTGKKAGTATITVKTADGSKTATCKVIVKAANVKVSSVKLNKTSLSMKKGTTQTLTATISPTNATNKNVTWTSSNTTVATVSNGKITAKKAGSTTITVKTADGSKTATCKVTVS